MTAQANDLRAQPSSPRPRRSPSSEVRPKADPRRGQPFYDKKRRDELRERKRIRTIVCPEGLTLEVKIGFYAERLFAFILDGLIGLSGALFVTIVAINFFGFKGALFRTLVAFLWYTVLNFYFLYFELAWRGRTPGKNFFNLRVINRHGGELTPTMTIARNLTRQVEIYFPIFFLFQIGSNENHLLTIIDFVFVVGVFVLPLISRDTLRLGDYLAGTLVIIAPKAALLEDLSAKSQKDAVFTFTEKQLGIYGDLELKTLETALRLANSKLSPALGQIAKAIVKKINYEREIASHETIRFLSDFYAAERGLLERGRLFGLRKDSQNSPAAPPVQGVASGKKPPELPKNPTLKSGAKTTEAQLGLANAQPKSTPQSPLDKWRAQRRTPPSRS